jgi:DNA-binding CsgD family transcriptional regulator
VNRKPNLISMRRAPVLRLDPTLTSEEAIILRTLAGGHTDRQVCNELRMDPDTFLRMMREMREKVGMTDNVSLVAWAKQHLQGADQRIDGPGKTTRLA